jgi:hypothetical protein
LFAAKRLHSAGLSDGMQKRVSTKSISFQEHPHQRQTLQQKTIVDAAIN